MTSAFLLVSLLGAPQTVTGERSVATKCEVSVDATYGYSRENPIKVGGLQVVGPSRQRRFLQSLAGPAGQPITFRRVGSVAPPEGVQNVILDQWQVTYAGAAGPIHLYIDQYRWDPPKAPRGLLCATAIDLAPPEPVTATTSTTLSVPVPRPPEMARPSADDTWQRIVDVAAAMPGVPPPIPLQQGSTERGMVFDYYRLAAVAVREIASRGEKPSRANVPKIEPSFIVVANPAPCSGESVGASDIQIQAGPSGRITSIGPIVTGPALQQLLPGVELRPGAAGARFQGYLPRGGSVLITYGANCPQGRFTLAGTFIGRKLVDAPGVPPSGLTATPPGYIGNMTLKVTFAIGPDGAPFSISVVSGDARYADAAIEAVKQWRFELPLLNGVHSFAPSTMLMDVVFR